MDTAHRRNRPGGGLAIIYKTDIKVKAAEKGIKITFEFSIWRISMKSVTMTVVTVYRPPYSQMNPSTVSSFIDEFSDFLTYITAKYKHILIMGDFNIHLNDVAASNTVAFLEVMQAFGLEQHVTEYTHKALNILDHIYSETGDELNITRCENNECISDHCLVYCEEKIPKKNTVRKTTKYRKFSRIGRMTFIYAIRFGDLELENANDLAKIIRCCDTCSHRQTFVCC